MLIARAWSRGDSGERWGPAECLLPGVLGVSHPCVRASGPAGRSRQEDVGLFRPSEPSAHSDGMHAEQSSRRTIPVPQASRLWPSWFLWVTAFEAAGFTFPALAGVATRDEGDGVAYVALVLAGLVEGAALGWSQAHVLSRAIGQLSVHRFTRNTSVGAALAYAIAMAPTVAADAVGDWPVVVQIGLAAVLGSALLASIGTAQWLELRRSLPHSASWILTTGGSWLVGLGLFFGIATPLWHEGQATALTVVIGVAAGLVMAASVAALTGLAVLRLLRHRTTLATTLPVTRPERHQSMPR